VSDAALTTRLNAARNAVGDSGQEQRLIKTLARQGFRFVGTIFEDQQRAVGRDSLATHGGDFGKMPSSAPRLSIVVLPFANLSGEKQQDDFVDAITENLTTDISRLPDYFVISCKTAFAFKGKIVDARQIGRELGVRYVLEGSVQSGTDRLRVNAQLIDAESGAHLWAERLDKPRADPFDMQDEIRPGSHGLWMSSWWQGRRASRARGTKGIGCSRPRPSRVDGIFPKSQSRGPRSTEYI
jgi:TolB-like protein